jgi:glutathione S-transferase
MALKLYYHPFASFCQKVLIALYENGTSFEPVLNLRPEGSRDPFGVTEAARQLRTACAIIDRELAATKQTWAAGNTFSMADCAAAPALYYVNLIMPLAANYRHAAALLDRLMERPSFVRVLEEARPFLQFFPMRGRTIASSD